MPGWLEAVANANPFTVVTNAARSLYNGLPVGNDAWLSLAWSVGLVVVVSMIATRKFRARHLHSERDIG